MSDTDQEPINSSITPPVLPELSTPLGSSPHMDTGGRERGREDGEGGETGSEEEDEEGDDGEDGEVSMGAGPLE